MIDLLNQKYQNKQTESIKIITFVLSTQFHLVSSNGDVKDTQEGQLNLVNAFILGKNGTATHP